MGQERKTAAVDGFEDADSEKLMMGGRNHQVGLPKQAGVAFPIFGVAKMDDVLGQTLLCFTELRRLLAEVLSSYNELEGESCIVQFVESVKKLSWILVVFPALVPEDTQRRVRGAPGLPFAVRPTGARSRPTGRSVALGAQVRNDFQVVVIGKMLEQPGQFIEECFEMIGAVEGNGIGGDHA